MSGGNSIQEERRANRNKVFDCSLFAFRFFFFFFAHEGIAPWGVGAMGGDGGGGGKGGRE